MDAPVNTRATADSDMVDRSEVDESMMPVLAPPYTGHLDIPDQGPLEQFEQAPRSLARINLILLDSPLLVPHDLEPSSSSFSYDSSSSSSEKRQDSHDSQESQSNSESQGSQNSTSDYSEIAMDDQSRPEIAAVVFTHPFSSQLHLGQTSLDDHQDEDGDDGGSILTIQEGSGQNSPPLTTPTMNSHKKRRSDSDIEVDGEERPTPRPSRPVPSRRNSTPWKRQRRSQ